MTIYQVRIGTTELEVDINGPFSDEWGGDIKGAGAFAAGPVTVEGLTGDIAGLTGEAEVVPGDDGRPSILDGSKRFA